MVFAWFSHGFSGVGPETTCEKSVSSLLCLGPGVGKSRGPAPLGAFPILIVTCSGVALQAGGGEGAPRLPAPVVGPLVRATGTHR